MVLHVDVVGLRKELVLDDSVHRLVVETLTVRNRKFFKGYLACKSRLRGWRYLSIVLRLDDLDARALAWWLEDEFLQAFIYGKEYWYYTDKLAPWEALYHQGVVRSRCND